MQQGWTVLFFIYAEDDETKSYADALLTTLKQSKHNEQLTLLVFESQFEQLSGGRITGKLNLFEHNTATGRRREKLLHDFGEVNPGERSVLAAVLRHIKDNDLLREKFLLFTWDHGTGFGIFDGDPTKHTEEFKAMPPDHLLPNIFAEEVWADRDELQDARGSDIKVIANRRTRFLVQNQPAFESFEFNELLDIKFKNTLTDKVEDDEVQINMLTLTEINSALKVLNMKTELVIMVNCWMQMLENGVELEETTKWFVAAETVNFFAGFDYLKILGRIAQNPAVDGKELATVTVQTLPNVFNNPTWEKSIKELVVSAVQPVVAGKVIKALDVVCESLAQALDNHLFNQIAAERLGCLDLSKGYFLNEDGSIDLTALIFCIDLLDYVARLAEKGLVTQESFRDLKAAIEEYRPFRFVGDNFKRSILTRSFLSDMGFPFFIPTWPTILRRSCSTISFMQASGLKWQRAAGANFYAAIKRIDRQLSILFIKTH
ncbi:clostripain-related cysteine peptidase [Paraflavitalea speifideaquila]|uniref:clostripain-related cysteine peptidase n=1 Tax=Paraflavitalea speifideaquila TaxID=3076558 RepID=UPI0028E4647B|nr:clostripain-related cysteine peptidase [Paraflavitalea speifideiaquila]